MVDGLRHSGAGVDSDDEFEEGGYFVSFRWFSEIHSVMGGRASVTPPALLDTSSTTFRGSEGETSASTSRTETPALAEGPSNDPARVEPSN